MAGVAGDPSKGLPSSSEEGNTVALTTVNTEVTRVRLPLQSASTLVDLLRQWLSLVFSESCLDL